MFEDKESKVEKNFEKHKVVQPRSAFQENGVSYRGGNSNCIGVTKSGTDEEFVLKNFNDGFYCAHEKLCYDLLALCGVKVPETYIVHEDKADKYWLASRKEPRYQDLYQWLFKAGPDPNPDELPRFFAQITEKLQKQSLLGSDGGEKPIRGLYENVAIFMFLQDMDTIGSLYGNIGLIEQEDCFQAVKIDPGSCWLFPTGEGYERNLRQLQNGKIENFYSPHDGNKSISVFKHCKTEQIYPSCRKTPSFMAGM